MSDGKRSFVKTYIRPSAWGVVLFAVLFFTYTRNSTFPFWYHWDEEGKAAQVIHDVRNMHHPLLLLNAVAVLEKCVQPGSESFQHVTNLGRITSAGFASAGIVCLSFLAWTYSGGMGALLVALLVGLHPLVFKLAHFFKEDTALLFGWSAALLSLRYYELRPSRFRAGVLGVATAFASSGKYVGVLLFACALLFILIQRKQRRESAAVFLLCAISAFLMINWQVFTAWGPVLEHFQREVIHQLNNETGVPPAYLLLVGDLKWMGVGVFFWAITCMTYKRKRLPLSLWVLLASGLLYFALLLCSVRLVSRYMLIPYVTAWWIIAWALACTLQTLKDHRAVNGVAAGLILILGVIGIRSIDVTPALLTFSGRDSRYEMARYIESISKTNDLTLIDFQVNLPGRYTHERSIKGWVPSAEIQRLPKWTPSQGEDMFNTVRKQGATLIAIAPGYVEKYFSTTISGDFGQFADLRWRKPFYEKLREEGEQIYYDPGEKNRYLTRELALYRIANPNSEE